MYILECFVALAAIVILILSGMVLCRMINKSPKEQNEEKIKQEIFDKLNKIIEDLKSTV